MMNGRTILDTVEEVPRMRELLLEDRELFVPWMRMHGVESSDITFTNLFLWRGARPVRIARSGDFLVIVRTGLPGDARLLTPVGDGDLASAVRSLPGLLAHELGHGAAVKVPAAIERMPERLARELESAGFNAEEDRDNFDYVYRVGDLAELKGRRFDGKRNQVRRCLDAHECSYEPIREETLLDCLRLEEAWCDTRHCDSSPELWGEFRAIREAFMHFQQLSLFGGAVRIEGTVQAFAIAERMDGETALVHFEKANPAVHGLYQLVNQWFCRNALSGFTWVNREQDLGIEGLRRAKMSYHPERFVKKFSVQFRRRRNCQSCE